MTIEDKTEEEDVIFDKSSKNEDYEKIISATREGIIKKYPPVMNNTRPERSVEARYKNNTNQVLKGKLMRYNFY